MGRKRKYNSKEEILNVRRKWALEYYYKNQEKCKKKRMDRYYEETNIASGYFTIIQITLKFIITNRTFKFIFVLNSGIFFFTKHWNNFVFQSIAVKNIVYNVSGY